MDFLMKKLQLKGNYQFPLCFKPLSLIQVSLASTEPVKVFSLLRPISVSIFRHSLQSQFFQVTISTQSSILHWIHTFSQILTQTVVVYPIAKLNMNSSEVTLGLRSPQG